MDKGTLPPILRPSVLARCARCITRNSFLLRFQLRSSHCPVDSHHDCVFSFRVRGGLFHVVIALQRIIIAFLKAPHVQRTRVKINSVSLLLHLGSRIPPSVQRANASDRYRRCRRDVRCLRLVVSHRRCRREFLILRLIVLSLMSRGLQYPAATSCSHRPRYYLSSCSRCSSKLGSSMPMW